MAELSALFLYVDIIALCMFSSGGDIKDHIKYVPRNIARLLISIPLYSIDIAGYEEHTRLLNMI